MPLQTIEIETAPNPRASVVILHGLGADGTDFLPFVDELDLGTVGPVRFLFPRAPVRPVTINGGYRMRAWYDVLNNDMQRREDEAGLRESMRELSALIEREKSRGMPPSRIVLGGFSQGCAMTLLTGLRHPQRLAGLIGMSGYLPLAATTPAERSEANLGLPIFLAHGHDDAVLPFDWGTRTRDALQQWGYDVQWHEYAMPHSVCPQEVADLNRWLLGVLA